MDAAEPVVVIPLLDPRIMPADPAKWLQDTVERSYSLTNSAFWYGVGAPEIWLTNGSQTVYLPLMGPLESQRFYRARKSMMP